MATAIASIVAALIAGIAGYATSHMNYQAQQETNLTNLQSVRETNALNRELAGEANQWQSEEWLRQFNMTNEFNLPVNQIQRYKDAGLNPSLAMGGNLVDATASQGSTPSANLASMQPFRAIAPQMSDWFNQSHLSDALMQSAQIGLVKAQTEKVKSEIKNTDVRTEYQELVNNAEELIQNYHPYSYVDENGVTVSVPGTNLRVESEHLKNTLDSQGIDLNNATMNDIMWNWYVMTGVENNYVTDSDGDVVGKYSPFNDPNYDGDFWYKLSSSDMYKMAVENLRGNRTLQSFSIKMAELDYEARSAEKAGMTAFNEFIEKNKDNPVMKILLFIRGFLQTSPLLNSSFPHINIAPHKSVSDHIHYHKYPTRQ